jgi:uncharacterized membrane-anchored protein
MKNILNRVPEVVFSFWVIKVLATTVGETGADYLSADLHFGLSGTSYLMSGILLMALLNQFRLKRYIPVSYWIVVVLMSVTGTLITDRLVDELKFSLVTINIVFSIALAIVLHSGTQVKEHWRCTRSILPRESFSTGLPFYSRSLWVQQLEIF